jgi:hypothetical protein
VLVKQLCNPRAEAKFTIATRAQLELSKEIAEQVKGEPIKAWNSVVMHCLDREPGWVGASKSAIASLVYNPVGTVSAIASARRHAFDAARSRDYNKSISIMQDAVNGVIEPATKGWLKQELGEYINHLNPAESQIILKSAREMNQHLLHPLDGIGYNKLDAAKLEQAAEVLAYIGENYQNANELVIGVNSLLEKLRFEPEMADDFEQGVKELAGLLGFTGQRPEKDFGVGPDALWAIGQGRYLVIECKNGAINPEVNKHDTNQLSGSMNWFKRSYDKSQSAVPVLIHPGAALK